MMTSALLSLALAAPALAATPVTPAPLTASLGVSAPAPASPSASPSASPGSLEHLLALPDNAARIAALSALLQTTSSPDDAARYSQAIAVLAQLDRTRRTDPTVTRLFLAAALSSDPNVRASALTAATAGGDPPLGGVFSPPATSAPVPRPAGQEEGFALLGAYIEEPPSPQALQKYNTQRLIRGRYQYTTGSGSMYQGTGTTYVSTVTTWSVFDGGGDMLSPLEFARETGDTETATTLERSLERSRKKLRRRLGGGLVLGLGGAIAIPLAHDSGVPFLVSGVGAVAILAATPPLISLTRDSSFASVYTTEEADALILAYNARLAKELGLSPAAAAGIDLQR